MIQLGELEKLVKTPEFRAEIQKMFFEAMNAGYAAEAKRRKGTIAELPGSKTIPYTALPWVVIDTYLVTPLSAFSGGMTVVSYEGIPVWMMQYFGQYPEEAIPCLKAALRAAYAEKKFFGGRGPRKLVLEKYAYENHPVLDTFEMFSGFESIVAGATRILGTHQYHGGLML